MSELGKSDIFYAKHGSDKLLKRIRMVVQTHFPDSVQSYEKMKIDDYREIVRLCQVFLCDNDYVRKIVDQIADDVRSRIDDHRFLIQTNLYLRAARPQVQQETESVGWHRESFYGPNMERSTNIWTPVLGVSKLNTLRFVPESQLIPETDIAIEQYEDPVTKKGSTGNLTGFLYAPKKIVSGVDFSKAEAMDVPYFHSSIFSGNLIHGSAVNHSNQTRFSIDFRIIPMRFYDKDLNKAFHLASGKSYFEEY